MANNMRHGVVTPARRHNPAPARAVNVRSKRRDNAPTRIHLTRLYKAPEPRICIKRRLGGIGDVLMTTPITKAIKATIPHCRLVYATDLEYSQGALADIIKHNPYVDELISSQNVRDQDYAYMIDITRTGLDKEKAGTVPPNRIDMFAEAVGVDVSADPVPIYIVEKSEQQWAKKYLKERLGRITKKTKIIAIQVRSNDARRTWPLDYMQELAYLLAAHEDMHVLLFDWGSTVGRWADDHPRLHKVMDMKLTEVAALVQQADVVVCPDSSMLHLAGALQKKIVTIFGPIPPDSRTNHYANATAMVKNLPCQYCWYTPRCTKANGNKFECLTAIKPKEVEQMVLKKLTEKHKVASHIVYGSNLTEKNQDKVIMIRRSTSGLGDILMVTPAIDALAKKFPGMKIEVACQRKLWPALENNPAIHKLVDVSESYNAKRYFMVVDVSNPCARYESTRVSAGKPVQKSRVEIFAEACGVRDKITTLKPTYYISDSERRWAEDFIKKILPNPTGKPKLAIGLRSAEMYRNWPEKHFEALFKHLKPHFDLILLDHSREYSFPEVIDACGFPLRRALAIMAQCDGLVTVDTSLLHFAAAVEVPTIALFGPIDYKPRCKGYDKVTVIKSDMDCVPCWRNGRTPCKATGLVRGYSKCMSAIGPKHVANTIINKFKSGKDGKPSSTR